MVPLRCASRFFFFSRSRSLTPSSHSHFFAQLGRVGLDGWIKGILGTYMRAKEKNLERRPDGIDDEQVISSARSYRRTSRTRLPGVSFGSRPDDDGHGARRNEARHRRSRFASIPIIFPNDWLTVLREG